MSDDVGFVCPHCTTKIKYTAGMTFGEVMSLRHDKEHLSHRVTCLRAELAAANTRMSKLDFERTAAELERDALRAERDALAAVTAERDRLREALKPFAAQLDHPGNTYEHNGVRMALVNQDILDRLCRRARAELEGVTEKEGAGNE